MWRSGGGRRISFGRCEHYKPIGEETKILDSLFSLLFKPPLISHLMASTFINIITKYSQLSWNQLVAPPPAAILDQPCNMVQSGGRWRRKVTDLILWEKLGWLEILRPFLGGGRFLDPCTGQFNPLAFSHDKFDSFRLLIFFFPQK